MFSSKVMMILAAVATVCILVVIGLQAGELSYYSAAPSIWSSP
jgi:hypothetical protein